MSLARGMKLDNGEFTVKMAVELEVLLHLQRNCKRFQWILYHHRANKTLAGDADCNL